MKTSTLVKNITVASGALLPLAAFADTTQDCQTVTGRGLIGLFQCASGLIGYIIGLISLAAFLFFLWGVMKFMKNAEDQKAREEGRWFMIWGTFALFVMASVWGFIQILNTTFGLPSASPQNNTTQSSGTGPYKGFMPIDP